MEILKLAKWVSWEKFGLKIPSLRVFNLKKNWRKVVVVLAIILAGNGFLVAYINSENTIHAWDHASYYRQAIEMSDAGWGGSVGQVIDSINSEYPGVLLLPVTDVLRLFGWDGNRLSFVLALFNVYAVPSMLLGGYLLGRLVRKDKFKLLIIVMLVATVSTILMTPIALARPDIGGIFIVTLILAVLLRQKTRWHKRSMGSNIAYAVVLAGLVMLLIVSRRTFAYWVVSAALAGGVLAVSLAIKSKRILYVGEYLLRVAAVATLSLILMFLLVRPQFDRLFWNYGDLYEYYRADSLSQMRDLLGLVGIITLAMIIAAAVLVVRYQNKTISRIGILACSQIVIVVVLFLNTQNFGEHHLYLVAPSVIFLLSTALYIAKVQVIKWCFALVMVCNFLNVYIVNQHSIWWGRPYAPEQRNDMEQLRAMSEYVEGLDSKVYVLASSSVFNDSLLREIFLPDTARVYAANVGLTHVGDTRDGFPKHFWDMKYIAVEYPPDRPDLATMRVVNVLARYVLEGRMENLELVREFKLMNGVTARFYEKVREYDEELIDAVDKEMRGYYPDKPELWAR